MTQDNVLSAIETMEAVFKEYLNDVPKTQRVEERAVIQERLDDFLRASYTLLPPSTPPNPSKICPYCKGKGKI
jgi:hypothetical protein